MPATHVKKTSATKHPPSRRGIAKPVDPCERFVRLNRHFPALPRRLLGRGVALPLRSSDALVRLKAGLRPLASAAYVDAGCGGSDVCPTDGSLPISGWLELVDMAR